MIDSSRLILGGVSFGGGMACVYAASHPEIKRIYSLAGDGYGVTIEHKILPFYRALKEAGAQSVQIVAVQDDHSFKRSGEEIVSLIIRWLKSPTAEP